jgi:hypothetical protein
MGVVETLFKGSWAEIAQGGVEALAVVPDFDVVEDGPPGLRSGGKHAGHAFGFQRANNAFHGGIVVRVAHSVHADLNVMGGQEVPDHSAGILAALVRVMEQGLGGTRWCDDASVSRLSEHTERQKYLLLTLSTPSAPSAVKRFFHERLKGAPDRGPRVAVGGGLL